MEHNRFIGTKEPATLADIQAIEQEYAFTLPDDYKAHILRHNGGWPQHKSFVQRLEEGGTVVRRISDFKSIKHGSSTLERSLRSLYGDLHNDLVPFGTETGGDLFALSVGSEDYGSVYYISHEFYKPPKRKEMKLPRHYGHGVHFLAPSFTAFMEGLVEAPNEE